jgi:hypothetical protein
MNGEKLNNVTFLGPTPSQPKEAKVWFAIEPDNVAEMAAQANAKTA